MMMTVGLPAAVALSEQKCPFSLLVVAVVWSQDGIQHYCVPDTLNPTSMPGTVRRELQQKILFRRIESLAFWRRAVFTSRKALRKDAQRAFQT